MKQRMFKLVTPCSVAWDSLSERDGGRHCGSCDSPVYDLDRMSPPALLELARSRPGGFCGTSRAGSVAVAVLSAALAACEPPREASHGATAVVTSGNAAEPAAASSPAENRATITREQCETLKALGGYTAVPLDCSPF